MPRSNVIPLVPSLFPRPSHQVMLSHHLEALLTLPETYTLDHCAWLHLHASGILKLNIRASWAGGEAAPSERGDVIHLPSGVIPAKLYEHLQLPANFKHLKSALKALRLQKQERGPDGQALAALAAEFAQIPAEHWVLTRLPAAEWLREHHENLCACQSSSAAEDLAAELVNHGQPQGTERRVIIDEAAARSYTRKLYQAHWNADSHA